MQHVNIQENKTNLSCLIEVALNGESFVVTKAGKPMVTVTAYQPPPKPPQRIGFMSGQIEVPDDFDTMGRDAILSMFGGLQRESPDADILRPTTQTGRPHL